MKVKRYASKKIDQLVVKTEGKEITLESPRLTFKSVNQFGMDFVIAKFFPLFSKKENMRFIDNGEPWSKNKVDEASFNWTHEWNEQGQFGVFAVFQKHSDIFLGCLQVSNRGSAYMLVDTRHMRAAEIGYTVDQQHWGNKYGREIAIVGKKYIKHLIKNAPEDSSLAKTREIVAVTREDNSYSQNVLLGLFKENKPYQSKGVKKILHAQFFTSLPREITLPDEPQPFEGSKLSPS